jgi:hypothetical protein
MQEPMNPEATEIIRGAAEIEEIADGVIERAREVPLEGLQGPVGKRCWAIAEGYIPADSTGEGPTLESHETACILNAGDADALIELTLFFKDREPVGPYLIEVPARRTRHVRFNDLMSPAPVPRDTDYSSLFLSTVPVVIQHTRLDSRQSALALLSTIAFSQ